jgi:hypothetical protein
VSDVRLDLQPDAPRALVVLQSAEFRKGRESAWRDLERMIGVAEKKWRAGAWR